MKIMEFIKKWMEGLQNLFRNDSKVQETEFLPGVLEVTEEPPSPTGRFLLWAFIVLLVAAGIWSLVGTVDEVAVASGKIVPIGQVKTVQSESKGVVKAIYVKEGQRVKKGDLLVELDPTSTGADLARLKKEIAYYEMDVARLQAEQLGGGFSPVPSPDLDPKDILVQMQLYSTRLNEYQAKVAAAQAAVAQQEAALRSAEAQAVKYRELLGIAKDQEERVEQLLKENAVALFQVMTYRSNRIQTENNLASQEAERVRLQAMLMQSQQQLTGVTAEWERDIAAKLVEDRKQLAAYQEELKKADERNRLSRLVSPVDGRVGQLAVHTVGGVVTEAQAVMEVVPDDVHMEVEAWVANKDIGFVQVGQKAEVKIDTFNFQKFGTVDATVREISPNATKQSEKDNDLKYRVLLTLDKEMVDVGQQESQLFPGMSLSAEIKIRQKRIIEFFLDPFRKYTSEALRER